MWFAARGGSPGAALSTIAHTERGVGVLGALVASATRPGPLFQNVAMGLGAFVALLFALDLVRLVRRGVKADAAP